MIPLLAVRTNRFCAWRRPCRRTAPVPRRRRTFRRPFDRDQSQSLSAAAFAGRVVCPPAGCRRRAAARRGRGESLRRAVGGACRAGAGTQILLPLVAGLARPGRAAVLTPTYAEHARAAALAGHGVTEIARSRRVRRCRSRHRHQSQQSGRPAVRQGSDLLAVAKTCSARGGVLVVDEAFMDVGPRGASLAAEVGRGNIVVLRSFGKFFGLAGLRLGFALRGAAARRAACRRCSAPGRFPARRSPSAPRRWPMEIGSKRRGAASPQAAARLDAILNGAGSRHRRRHDTVPADPNGRGQRAVSSSRTRRHFDAALFPIMPRGCALACRRPSRIGSACRLRWPSFRGSRLGFER